MMDEDDISTIRCEVDEGHKSTRDKEKLVLRSAHSGLEEIDLEEQGQPNGSHHRRLRFKSIPDLDRNNNKTHLQLCKSNFMISG
mmetsp:Transcript_77760/g.217921  ORF Transcript_77760/g.217921 Transcript_77760/m.217921 type:complete len:84 (+) Transcript_77760:899-1150(+)